MTNLGKATLFISLIISFVSLTCSLLLMAKSGSEQAEVARYVNRTEFEALKSEVKTLKAAKVQPKEEPKKETVKQEDKKEEPKKEEEKKEPEKTLPTGPVVGVASANVRSDASTTASVIKVAAKGESVKPTGNTKNAGGYAWTEVTLSDGKKGWIVSDFISQ